MTIFQSRPEFAFYGINRATRIPSYCRLKCGTLTGVCGKSNIPFMSPGRFFLQYDGEGEDDYTVQSESVSATEVKFTLRPELRPVYASSRAFDAGGPVHG